MPYCTNCGADVGEEDRFCLKCGNQLTGEIAVSSKVAPVPVRMETTAWRPPMLESVKEAFTTLIKSTTPVSRPSYEVYRTLSPYTGVKALLYIAGGLFIVGMFITSLLLSGIGTLWIQYLGFVMAGAISPLIFVAWLFKQDRLEPEPVQIPLLLLGWGVMSAAVIAIFHNTIPIFVAAQAWIAGPILEEPAKILGVYLLATMLRYRNEFNDHLDGLVWGAAAGAGFAIAENFIYIYNFTVLGNPLGEIVLVRNTSAIMHTALTAIVGRWLGLMKAKYGTIRPEDLVPGLVVAMIIHALWNTQILILKPILMGILVYSVYKYAGEAIKDEGSWGWSIGHAPIEAKETIKAS